jgi:hypothetical protein
MYNLHERAVLRTPAECFRAWEGDGVTSTLFPRDGETPSSAKLTT